MPLCRLCYQQLSVKVCVHVFEEFYCFCFILLLNLKKEFYLLLNLFTFLGDFRISFINLRSVKQKN